MTMPFTNHRTAMLVGLVALGASPLTLPATANARGNELKTVTIPVAYGDLDLTRAEDVKRLIRRIDLKAARFCREANSVAATQKMIRKCRDEIAAANSPKVQKAIDAAASKRAD